MTKKFYLTTAVPYVNAAPHIGFALEVVQADVLARYHRSLKEDVFFLAGTDENSLKNFQAAQKEGITTQKLVDRNSKVFKNLGPALNLSFDDFIRTTESRHIKGAQKLWQATQKNIYKKKYKGLYCVGCEMFFKESELENGLCPEHKTKPEVIEEENYFFKLSNYQKQLEKIIESGEIEIIPESRKNETLSFIKSGLEDFSISRSAKRGDGWGIEVPGDNSQRVYVWFDALINYITALGYGSNNLERYKKYWPADLHCIGKGILRFHAIYWPAMLLSVGLPLPKKIFVHGYLTTEGQKMSKSLGNVIDPFELVEKYGADPVRYFLLREFSSTEDGDFSIKRLEERYNADLANGLGNLVSRVLTLSEKIEPEKENIPTQGRDPGIKDAVKGELVSKIKLTKKNYQRALEEIKFNEALEAIWGLVSDCDNFVEKNKPWELDKGSDRFKDVISELLTAVKESALLLKPFLPQTAEKILKQIKENKKAEALFPRL
ncbi:methionine--tRNA ligase [Patescibacteria group bacterium]|nr:methionine--tRNA ligase [Patescibacteria group bacterium]